MDISELVRSHCKSEAKEELELSDAESQFLSSIKYVSCNFTAIYCFVVQSSINYLRQRFPMHVIVCYVTSDVSNCYCKKKSIIIKIAMISAFPSSAYFP